VCSSDLSKSIQRAGFAGSDKTERGQMDMGKGRTDCEECLACQ
jgi:hypothetical protein